ncbi:MAG: histidine kinase, partial [Solobacterium sp.]|nr:histidine kinase [Solobacterium sp.]
MDLFSLNMTLHISYAVILVTLIVSQILRRRNDAENRLFLLILIFMVLSSGARLSFVLSNRYLQGRLCDILDLFSTLCGCALFPLFFAYILYDTGKRRLADQGFRRMIMISAVISAAFFLAAAVSMAYDSQHRLSVFGLNDISLNHLDILLCRITQYTLITSFVISRKGAGMARRKAVIAFCLLMIAAAVFDIFTVRYDISHLFATSTALGIYLNFQQEAEIRKEAMELELINTRLSLILGKIRPDFVLATLEEIEKLCMEDAEEAQSAISLLSDYLRGNIDRIDTNDVILFTDELEHIQN